MATPFEKLWELGNFCWTAPFCCPLAWWLPSPSFPMSRELRFPIRGNFPVFGRRRRRRDDLCRHKTLSCRPFAAQKDTKKHD